MSKGLFGAIIKFALTVGMVLWMILHILLNAEFPFTDIRTFWMDLFFLLLVLYYIVSTYCRRKEISCFNVAAEIVYASLLTYDVVTLF